MSLASVVACLFDPVESSRIQFESIQFNSFAVCCVCRVCVCVCFTVDDCRRSTECIRPIGGFRRLSKASKAPETFQGFGHLEANSSIQPNKLQTTHKVSNFTANLRRSFALRPHLTFGLISIQWAPIWPRVSSEFRRLERTIGIPRILVPIQGFGYRKQSKAIVANP